MPEMTFGQFLHHVRKRTNGTQIAKVAGISYVYLLDLEKGARPVPSDTVLMALSDALPFNSGEKEKFFDLAASESDSVPLDVAKYLKENKELVSFIRKMQKDNIKVKDLFGTVNTADYKGSVETDE